MSKVIMVETGHYYQEPASEVTRLKGLQVRAKKYTENRRERLLDKAEYLKQISLKVQKEITSH